MHALIQILILLAAAVPVVMLFQRLQIPSSLAYLLVGVLLSPHSIGVVIDMPELPAIAEFGIVFLLFTIGLNYSLPQIYALRHQVLGLGTAQVVLTTTVVGLAGWLAGLPAAAAFVIGAVFAQSSSSIMSKQLGEQSEENSRHGRLGVAMSVFQDVTAVPFIVIIPLLQSDLGTEDIVAALGGASIKALLALAVVIVAGRWLLRPLFRLITRQRSAELFTLTVLLVALAAAGTTSALGLSLAFGAFLAGMMLGETEFRHQVESTIGPFRDVLLGLFFVGVGLMVDPRLLPGIWHLALLGAVVMMVSKAVIVAVIVRRSGLELQTAWRIGLLLSVGGEFGLALVAVAIGSEAIDSRLAQILLTSVLFGMIGGALVIRFNGPLANLLVRSPEKGLDDVPTAAGIGDQRPTPDVIICGYGRIGQSVGNFLEQENIPFVALDLDATRVRDAHAAGEPVFFGEASNGELLDNVGLARARLVVIAHNNVASALKTLAHVRMARPTLQVMVRTLDETHVETLEAAGALEVVPETLEAGLMMASQALLLLNVPASRVMRRMQEQRAERYPLIREVFAGEVLSDSERGAHHLRTVVVPERGTMVGRRVGDIDLPDTRITALVRNGSRIKAERDTLVQANDVLVLFGNDAALQQAELSLQR